MKKLEPLSRGSRARDIIDGIDVHDDVAYEKKVRRDRNKKNKDRARRMEQTVASLLGGFRVPMSGAGSIKGDGIVDTGVGLMILECKTTERTLLGHGAMRLEIEWLRKLKKDVYAMRAAFGMFVGHFHGVRGYFVFIDVKFAERLRLNVDDAVDVIEDYPVDRKGVQLRYDTFPHLYQNRPFLVTLDQDQYYVCNIDKIVKALEDIRNGEEAS